MACYGDSFIFTLLQLGRYQLLPSSFQTTNDPATCLYAATYKYRTLAHTKGKFFRTDESYLL
jgi:hypothetical protein